MPRRDGLVKQIRTLYVSSRRAWRLWLSRNYRSASEIWLVYYRKSTGKKRIAYNDAVEEALCFGWIDSRQRTLDGERSAQRFSPRRSGRAYSQANIVRLRKLIRQRKVRKEVLQMLGDLPTRRYRFPADILAAIRANSLAWGNFRKFSLPYREIRIAFIDGARGRPKEFHKRLRYFIRMSERGKQYGYGGIERHF